MSSKIIIINGLSASGKTTYGEILSRECSLPLYSRDNFKEILFDVLGVKDRDWSQNLGNASYDILYHVLEESMKSHQNCIVETNFSQRWNETFAQLQKKYSGELMQIYFTAKDEVLLQRFMSRADTDRHMGHCDSENTEEFQKSLSQNIYEPLKINGTTIVFDTTIPSQKIKGDIVLLSSNFLKQ